MVFPVTVSPWTVTSLGAALMQPFPGTVMYAKSSPMSRNTLSQVCMSTPPNLTKSSVPSVLTIHIFRSLVPFVIRAS